MKINKLIICVCGLFLFSLDISGQQAPSAIASYTDSVKTKLALTDAQKISLKAINDRLTEAVNQLPKGLQKEERKKQIERTNAEQLKQIKLLFSRQQYELYIEGREKSRLLLEEEKKRRTVP